MASEAVVMKVVLDPELEAFARAKVAAGDYPDVEAVLTAGLRRWRDDEVLRCRSWDEIQELVRAGIVDIEHGRCEQMDQAELNQFFRQLACDAAGAGKSP